MEGPKLFPYAVQMYLFRFEQRRILQRLVRRTGLAVFLAIVCALAWCFVDRMIALPAWMRVVVLSINSLAGMFIVGRALVPIVARIDLLGVARDVEGREHRWGERLVTLVSRLLGPQ